MVMFVWAKIRGFDADFPRDAEMNAEPVVAGEFEEHSFAARCRS